MSVLVANEVFNGLLHIDRNPDVFYRPAHFTDKVIVRFSHRFIDVGVAPEAEAVDESLFGENVEIAIDVSQTQRRELIPKCFTDPVRGDVLPAHFEKLIDTISLFTLAKLRCHGENIVNATYAVNN